MNELLEEIYQLMAEDLQEGRRKRVFRKGKLKKKLFCPKGMKAKGMRCVPIKGQEKMLRKNRRWLEKMLRNFKKRK